MSNPQIPLSGSVGSAGPFPTLGATTVTLADANHTLTDPSETCYQYILIGGTQTVSRQVIAPLISGLTYLVINETSGGLAVNFGGASGATVSVPQSVNGSGTWVSCDGTNYGSAGGQGVTVANIEITLNADYTLSAVQAKASFIQVTSDGASNGVRSVFAPLVEGRSYTVQNKTSEGFAIILTGATGSGVSIAPNTIATATSDGVNYYSSSATLPDPLTVPANSGSLNSSGNAPLAWGVQSLTTASNTPASFAPEFVIPPSTTFDCSFSVLGRSTVGDYYRADFFVTVDRTSAGVPTVNPSTPAATNVRTQGSGSSCAVTVTVSGNNIIVTATGLSGVPMDWVCTPQIQELISVAFTPADLPDLAFWQRSDIVTESGGNVSVWPDQSGNSRNAVPTNNPTQYFASGGANNLPYLVTTNFAWLDLPFSLVQPCEIVLVGRLVSDTGSSYLFDTDSNGNCVLTALGQTILHQYAGTSVPGPTLTLGDDFYVDAAFDGASSQISINGGAVTLGNPGTGLAGSNFRIGGYGGNNFPLAGFVYEVIGISGRVLTGAERAEINSYINARYGIA